jgi:large exoprotein involved in heme utilization and adhesion
MASDNRSKVWYVSAIGGTQVGVVTHSLDNPKQVILKKPARFLNASGFNTASGKFNNVPRNTSKVITRSSAHISASQTEVFPITTEFNIPAGSMAYDAANVEAAILVHICWLYANRAELVDYLKTGIV